MISIAQALQTLAPGAIYRYEDEDFNTLEWMSDDIPKPSKRKIQEEIKRLEKEAELNAYKDQRRMEYPNFIEYIDGVVKGDQEQIDAYIAACLAVKEKYPKPEVK